MSRLVLSTSIPEGPIPDANPDTVGLWCFEEFSVGLLSAWPNVDQFTAQRAAFWSTTQQLDLPDGSKLDYLVWYQFFPHFSLDDLIALADGPEANFPDRPDLPRLAATADRIEIWADNSAWDLLSLWYIVAELDRLGINPAKLHLRDVSDKSAEQPPVIPLQEADRQAMLRRWQAATRFPALPPADLPQDAATRKVFEVLASRQPDPVTGVNVLDLRLLQSSQSGWRKASRVVAEAMHQGWKIGDSVGDGILMSRLFNLSCQAAPLIELQGDGTMLGSKVRLTITAEKLGKRPGTF